MKIVVKFGGSSLASAEQFKKVADIIHADPHRRFVVPSAPGKRFDGDTKVTDMLYGCYDLAEAGKNFDGALADIKARYDEIIEGLGLDLTLDKEFETIHEQFRLKAGRNYAASRGEYLNGIVLANYLGFEFIDAATVIRFDDAGNFEADRTDLILSSRLKDVEYAVVPGFYGAQDDGVVTTFSMRMYMRIGQMFLVSLWQIRELSRILKRLKQLHIRNCVSFLTWAHLYCMKMLFSRYVKRAFRSISATQISRMIWAHGL